MQSRATWQAQTISQDWELEAQQDYPRFYWNDRTSDCHRETGAAPSETYVWVKTEDWAGPPSMAM